MMSGKYKIITLNCNGLRDKNKRRAIFQFLKLKDVQIALLQETHIEQNDVQFWKQEWNTGLLCPNPGTSLSAGQVVLTTKHMSLLENKIHEPGRLQEVVLKDNDYVIRIFNIYGYNSESLRIPLFKTLEMSISIYKNEDFLCVSGDFNVVLSNMLDKEGGNMRRLASQVYLNTSINNYHLIDTWRNENPTQKRFTWSQKQPPVKCRLDYFLIPQRFLKYVKSTRITPSIKSDHKCVELTAHIDKYIRGPGLWKINNDILSDEVYKDEIRNTIETVWRDNQNYDIAARYDFLKYKLRQTTKRYCKIKAKGRNLRERELLLKIEHLDQIQDEQGALTEQEQQNLSTFKQDLEHLLQYKAKGAWVRSRIEYIELHEKSNSFFHSIAKEKHEKQTIFKLHIKT